MTQRLVGLFKPNHGAPSIIEPGKSREAPHASGFRFSLRALFFFVLVAGVTFSQIATFSKLEKFEAALANANEELDKVTSENEELRAHLGEFQDDEPNQLCAVASPFRRAKDLRWRWQVVAPDSNYRLCATVKDVPEEGVPAYGGQVLVPQLPRGECSIEATLQQDHSGEWQLHAECVRVDLRYPAIASVESSIDIPKSLGDSLAQSEYPLIKFTTSSLTRVDMPVELLRPISFQQDSQVAESTARRLGEGIILWIEKDPPAPDSELPAAPP